MGGTEDGTSGTNGSNWVNQKVGDIKTALKGNAAEFNAFYLGVEGITGKINETMDSLINAINPLNSEAFKAMDEFATQIQHSFGLSKSRIDEFKTTIADAAPELVKMGLSEEAAATNLESIMNAVGTAASVSQEAMVELSATAQVTGQDVGILASSFRSVGVSITDAGDEMKKVVDYARSVGVSVNAVSTGVVTNLGKLNTFNFSNGVEGLAKMAAQSTRLGISMENTFMQAEKLLSPESAIDMAASLQRLGVTASGLLDPLRAMDLAQNDPEALQKEIVGLSKEFTRFNEQTGKMEILPGAKRRMREVAEAVGMTGEQFASMALKSADFEMKLKQIKMPDIAGDQETKELIASMAQIGKGGVATIKVKDEQTGIIQEKKVEELTGADIKNLQKANEESSKSMEDIAINQLDQTKQINSYLQSGVVATKFAKATSPSLNKFYGLVSDSYKAVAKGTSDVLGSTEEMRKVQQGLYGPMEDLIVAQTQGDKEGANRAKTQLGDNFINILGEFETKFSNKVSETQEQIINQVKEKYSQPIKVESTSDAKVDVNLNLKSDISGLSFSPQEVQNIKDAMLKDPEFAKKMISLAGGTIVGGVTGGKNEPGK